MRFREFLPYASSGEPVIPPRQADDVDIAGDFSAWFEQAAVYTSPAQGHRSLGITFRPEKWRLRRVNFFNGPAPALPHWVGAWIAATREGGTIPAAEVTAARSSIWLRHSPRRQTDCSM